MTSPVWRFREKQRAEVHQDPANTEFFAQQDVAERLVREAAQNSMDAVRNGSAAELSFRFVTVPASAWPRYFGSLWPHLESQPELDGILPTAGESVPCLLIEDFGTTGLTGDLEPDTSGLRDDERSSRLFWFFKNVGRTSKTGEQLGSFGIGKTVFPDSSRINTFYGYSVREVAAGESPIVLLGQSQLREHRLPGSRDLDPFGFYCWHEGAGDSLAQRAITEAAELADFRQAFAIHRTERETGLSVVVPYPDGNLTRESLARAVLLQFFYPILSGRLTVLIEEADHGELLIFSAETVLDAIGAVGFPEDEAESLRRRVRLAQWSLTDGPAARIDLARPANPQAPSFDPSMIGASRLLELSRSMIAGKRMAARFPVPVERKRSPLAWSHVDVFLEYERHGLGRDDMYLRQGLTLVEHTGHAKHPGLRAILVAEDPAVYELLRSSENVAHTAWRQRSAVRLTQQYDRGSLKVKYVLELVREFVRCLLSPEDEEDWWTLADLFPQNAFSPLQEQPHSGGGEGRRHDGPTRRLPPDDDFDDPGRPSVDDEDFQRKVRQWRAVCTRDGIRIEANAEYQGELRPMRFVAAYGLLIDRKLKQHHPDDFSFQRERGMVRAAKARVEALDHNVLAIVPDHRAFSVEIRGFDRHRSLDFRITTEGL